MLYEFESGYNPAGITQNICCEKNENATVSPIVQEISLELQEP